jgi:ribonuclease PH
MAFNRLLQKGTLTQQPLKKKVAAISVGVFRTQALLDLCYEEDRDAEVDCNLVMCEDGQFVEIQGSGEETTFSDTQLAAMLALGKKGITDLCKLQDAAIRACEPKGPAVPQPGAVVNLADAFAKK